MKKSEKMLLGVFALLFLLIVGGGGFAMVWKKYTTITGENERLRDRLIEMNTAITQGAEWQRKWDWIEEKVPTMASKQEASSRLLKEVQKQAASAGVDLGEKEFIEARPAMGIDGLEEEEGGYFDQATVRITFEGAQEKAFFTWLHALTQPDAFLGVTRLRIEPSGEGKTILGEIELTQYYRQGGPQTITRTQ